MKFGNLKTQTQAHLATVLGAHAIEQRHQRVRFYSTIELVNALQLEKAAAREWDRWCNTHAAIEQQIVFNRRLASNINRSRSRGGWG